MRGHRRSLEGSFFFYDTDDATDDGTAMGTLLDTWTLPRTQSSIENCTLHNYNVVPLRNGRDVLVHGSYQSGTSAVDFTDLDAADPSTPVEIAWSDPPPIVPPTLGGVWSSYWYNNFIYETNINEGLNIFRLCGEETGGAMAARSPEPTNAGVHASLSEGDRSQTTLAWVAWGCPRHVP